MINGEIGKCTMLKMCIMLCMYIGMENKELIASGCVLRDEYERERVTNIGRCDECDEYKKMRQIDWRLYKLCICISGKQYVV